MWFWISALGVSLLGFGLAMARSWACWYLRELEAEESQERARIFACGVEAIRDAEAKALDLTNRATREFLEETDPRYLRPRKAAKIIRAARQYEDCRGYLRAHATDPEMQERYAAWRGTQTRRKLVSVGEDF